LLYSYFVGLDLGQKNDPTALFVAEEPVWVPARFRDFWGGGKSGWVSPSTMHPAAVRGALDHAYRNGRPEVPHLIARHAHRFELGTPYPEIIRYTQNVLRLTVMGGKPIAFLVDRGGPGQPVIDLMRQQRMHPIGVFMHGGSRVVRDRDGFRVPKKDLVDAVQILMERKKIKFLKSLPYRELLAEELGNFRMKMDPRTRNASWEHWREGMNDDVVLAAAMCCWFRGFWPKLLDIRDASEESREDKASTGSVRTLARPLPTLQGYESGA
jgi:hypothetical protein